MPGKHILFTGTTGMVGHYIDFIDWPMPVLKAPRMDFDITNLEAVRRYVDRHADEIGMIIHLAAETDVDRCELEPDHAYRVNTIGTQNMVYQAQQLNVPFVYTCTVGIYGGDDDPGPFHEYSRPHPANMYGQTKLFAEQIVREQLTRYFVVRPGWMMGGVSKDKKFVAKIIKQILGGSREIFATEQNVGSPTYAKELLEHISRLIQTTWWGVYNCTNTGRMSRYEVAKVIVDAIDPSIRVKPVGADYFKLPAKRALSEYADNRMLRLRGLDRMTSVQDALAAYLEEIKQSGFVNAVLRKT